MSDRNKEILKKIWKLTKKYGPYALEVILFIIKKRPPKFKH